jgi:hypothetical protein
MDGATITADRIVATIASVLAGERSVMMVEHWATDDWVFRPAGSYYASEMVDVPFAELVRIDPSLAELADLPADWVASRRNVGQAWRRRWVYEDTRYLWDEPGAEPDAGADGGHDSFP